MVKISQPSKALFAQETWMGDRLADFYLFNTSTEVSTWIGPLADFYLLHLGFCKMQKSTCACQCVCVCVLVCVCVCVCLCVCVCVHVCWCACLCVCMYVKV